MTTRSPSRTRTFTLTLTDAVGATLGDATATGTIIDDGDTAARLTASDIEDTTATLTISGHTDGWWYQRNALACTAVTAGTTAVSIGGLKAVTNYDYTAYSDSACSTKLASVEFRTLAPDGTPTVSVSDAQVSEDGTWMRFKVSLSHPSREPVKVWYVTSGGTATSGVDFEAREGQWAGHVSFGANSSETARSASVIVLDDQDPEPDETFTLTLTKATGATLGDATATGTILDDGDTAARLKASDIEDTTATLTISNHPDSWWYRDKDTGTSRWGACTAVSAGTTAVGITGLSAVTGYAYTAYSDSACSTKLASVKFRTLAPEGTPTVSVSDAEVSEDGGSISFAVSLSQPSREPLRVWYVTSGGTATRGTDFAASLWPTFVYFSPNSSETTKHAGVIVYDDQEPEPDETFTLTLTRATGATLGDATATGTILDDGDTAATLTPSDIEDTTATLTISGHTDSWWYRRQESGTSRWGACTAVTAGTSAVSISGLAALTEYVYWAYSDSACSTKLANVEFRTLAPDGTPTVSVSDAQVSEDGSWMRFKVSLSHPSREPVKVRYVTSDVTARGGTDYRANEGSRAGFVNFSANSWETVNHAYVGVNDDQEPEPDETFTLTLTRATGATLGDATATGTILDDGDTAARLAPSQIEDTTATLTISNHTDSWWYRGQNEGTAAWGDCTAVSAGTTAVSIGGLTAASDYAFTAYSDSTCRTKLARVEFRTLAAGDVTPAVSVSDAQVSEDGAWMQFWVSLSAPSREEVKVDFHTSDGTATNGTDFRTLSGTLTFAANSREPELVPVSVHDDQEPEPDETFTLTLTNPRGATLGDATATGTIKDDGDIAATGVALASDPGDDDTYATGDTVRVEVTFSEAVDVDTAGGTPRLKFDLGGATGSGERWATYASGSGETALAFVYKTVSGDASTGGVAVLADTLELNGGTIKSVATQFDAALGHAGLARDTDHRVDAVVPQLLSGEIDGGTMTLQFSEALDPRSTGGEFHMRVENPEIGVVGFRAMGGVVVDGATVTVGMGDLMPRAHAGLERNHVRYTRRADGSNGTLRDLAGNPVKAQGRSRLYTQDGNFELLLVEIDLVNVTKSAPEVTGVAVSSKAGADKTYGLGDTIRGPRELRRTGRRDGVAAAEDQDGPAMGRVLGDLREWRRHGGIDLRLRGRGAEHRPVGDRGACEHLGARRREDPGWGRGCQAGASGPGPRPGAQGGLAPGALGGGCAREREHGHGGRVRGLARPPLRRRRAPGHGGLRHRRRHGCGGRGLHLGLGHADLHGGRAPEDRERADPRRRGRRG